MSLFFLLAGASSYYALLKRTGGEYIKERFNRLFIPFVFGVLVLIPPQSYLGLLNHSDYSQSFIAWFPNFFQLKTEDMDAYFLGPLRDQAREEYYRKNRPKWRMQERMHSEN